MSFMKIISWVKERDPN